MTSLTERNMGMKYFGYAVALILAIMLSLPTIASGPQSAGQEEELVKKYRTKVLEELLPQYLATLATKDDAMNQEVLKHRVEWTIFDAPEFRSDHKLALAWIQRLLAAGKLNEFANAYQDKYKVAKKKVNDLEAYLWGTAVKNYEVIIKHSEGQKLPSEYYWDKPPHKAIRGTVKKHDVILTYLATAYITALKESKAAFVNEKMTTFKKAIAADK